MREMIEEAVLGALMLNEAAWPPEVFEIEPEYFASIHNSQIFEAIKAVKENGSEPDECSVIAQLEKWETKHKGSEILEMAAACPTAVNLQHWSKLLVENGIARIVRQKAKSVVEQINKSNSPDEMLAVVQTMTSEIKRKDHSGVHPIQSKISETLSELKDEFENPTASRIAITGLADLDKKAELRAGQLTIIAGRPSMGKSSLAGNIAERCGRNITMGAVVVFSLEMDTISLIKRMMSSKARVDSDMLKVKAHDGSLIETCNALHSLNLYIDDRPNLSIGSVRAALSGLGKIRLVIFDYIQLAKMDTKAERHDLRVGEITKGLKSIAKDFNCHVIGLSQLNRSVEVQSEKIPKMANLRDSGNIEEDADNVWLLYRSDYYGKEGAGDGENVARIIIAKQRHGITGTFMVQWDGPTQTFRNLQR